MSNFWTTLTRAAEAAAGSRFLRMVVGLLWLSGSLAQADEPAPHRPFGMPDNELIAYNVFTNAVNSEDLADALGINQWNFQVQVPDGTVTLQMIMHWIDNGQDRELGRVEVLAEKRDKEGVLIKGAQQFRVLVMVSPVDQSTDNPLLESAKLRVFAKGFFAESTSTAIIKNPFKGEREGVLVMKSAGLVRDRKVPTGRWDGLDTRFDLFSTADYKHVLRISFQTGMTRIAK